MTGVRRTLRYGKNVSFRVNKVLQLGMDTGYTVYAFEFADTGRQSGAPFWSLNFQFDSNPELIDEDRVQVSSSLVSGFLVCP